MTNDKDRRFQMLRSAAEHTGVDISWATEELLGLSLPFLLEVVKQSGIADAVPTERLIRTVYLLDGIAGDSYPGGWPANCSSPAELAALPLRVLAKFGVKSLNQRLLLRTGAEQEDADDEAPASSTTPATPAKLPRARRSPKVAASASSTTAATLNQRLQQRQQEAAVTSDGVTNSPPESAPEPAAAAGIGGIMLLIVGVIGIGSIWACCGGAGSSPQPTYTPAAPTVIYRQAPAAAPERAAPKKREMCTWENPPNHTYSYSRKKNAYCDSPPSISEHAWVCINGPCQ